MKKEEEEEKNTTTQTWPINYFHCTHRIPKRKLESWISNPDHTQASNRVGRIVFATRWFAQVINSSRNEYTMTARNRNPKFMHKTVTHQPSQHWPAQRNNLLLTFVLTTPCGLQHSREHNQAILRFCACANTVARVHLSHSFCIHLPDQNRAKANAARLNSAICASIPCLCNFLRNNDHQ